MCLGDKLCFITSFLAGFYMTTTTVEQALEDIYASLHDNNKDLDTRIASLKTALAAKGEKSVQVDSSRIYQSNRQGRKLMESYFKKRGVTVTFSAKE